MRFSAGLGWLTATALALASGCGSDGGGGPAECDGTVCPCSEQGIRAAVAEGDGTYTFDCDGPTTILTRGELTLDRDVALDGGGLVTLDASGRHRVLRVLRDVTATLSGFTITNGRLSEENGGGIRNDGTLMLDDCMISRSSAGREGGCRTDDPNLLCAEGGGIWNGGTLTLVRTTVTDSVAHFGGGIANRGEVTLVESEVRDSIAQGCRGVGAVLCSGGGGIWSSGSLTMEDSAISGCSADWGGGLYDRSTAILRRSIFAENSAGFDGGGLLSFETLIVTESTVADNAAGQSGGGIANEVGSLEVSASTISSNTAAAAGGAIYNPAGASTSVVNATLSGNVAQSGGAIYTGGSLSLVSSTLAENEAPDGSALFDPGSSSASPRSIRSTLVLGRCGGASFDSEGYNVESTGDTCGFDQPTDRPSQGPIELGPLGDNGGPTLTHALPAGSIATDLVPEADCIDESGAPLGVDQRGEPRPAGESLRCDVGAFEAQR